MSPSYCSPRRSQRKITRAIAAGADGAYEEPGRLDGWRALLMELLWPPDASWSAAA
jgi:hypothetical protein